MAIKWPSRCPLVDILYNLKTKEIVLDYNMSPFDSRAIVEVTEVLSKLRLFKEPKPLKSYDFGRYRFVRKELGPLVRVTACLV